MTLGLIDHRIQSADELLPSFTVIVTELTAKRESSAQFVSVIPGPLESFSGLRNDFESAMQKAQQELTW
jgi:hypothetical protein